MQKHCIVCGTALSSNVSGGHCPKCLLSLAWSAHSSGIPSANQETVGPLNPKTSSAVEDEHLFGDYELGPEITRGGMGVVYRARQISLNRAVALKMIGCGEFASPMLVGRFQIEAAAAARLDHPNIVPIYEIGEFRGQVYYSMKLVEGGNLAAQIADSTSPFSNKDAASLLIRIAEAIHYAHQHGVLHRDLKPSNILLDTNGPRVADFGLAKVIQDESGITLSTATLGTPAYMAPEQATGRAREVSVAADIYSVGAILYEMLTKRPPFQAESALATMRQVIEEEPARPRSLNPAVAADLETICLKCLQKEPAKRYGTAQALADDLARFLRDEPIHARPVTRVEGAWRWCRRKPALASAIGTAVVLLLGVLIGSPLAVYRINHERQRAEKGELAAQQHAYASDMNRAHQAVQKGEFDHALQLLNRHRPAARPLHGSRREEALISESALHTPDPALDPRGWEWRYLWRQCQGEERFILGQHANGASAVGTLADGKTVFSAGYDKCVRLWDLESRREIGVLRHSENVIGAAASPDGRWLATAIMKGPTGQPVLLWDLASRSVAATFTTVTPNFTNFWLRPGSIAFSPDSRRLAFATVFGGIRIWDVNTHSELTNLPSAGLGTLGLGLAFSPDSRSLACNENDYGAIVLWDIASRSPIDRWIGHESVVRALAFSRDGQTLASGGHDRTIRVWSLREEGRGTVLQINPSGEVTSLAFSPDGRTLAATGSGAGRVIRLMDVVTGKEKAELRGHLKPITGLAFTQDGRTLLSASYDGTVRAWDVVPRAAENSAHLFARNSIDLGWNTYGPALCLSPDGRHLLTVYTNHTFSVWDTVRLVEGERHFLPLTNTTIAAMASGGKRAAFGSGSGEVMLWNEETGESRFFARPVTNRIIRLVFSPDGRYLAVVDEPKTLTQMAATDDDKRRIVRVWDVATRKETRVLSTDGAFLTPSLKFSADSKMLMAGSSRGQINLWQLDGTNGLATFHGHFGWVCGLAMLPDGRTLSSAGSDIRYWDVKTRREKGGLNPRGGGLNSLALSPDGRRLAAGATDGQIVLWDVESHQEVATLEGHKESVMQLAFTSDGQLVSASQDQLRVWRAASWAEIDASETGAGK